MRQLRSGQSSEPPPYDPNTAEKFCQDNGGPTIFTEIVKMMTPTRTNRACTTKQETDARNEAVVVLYTMCYSQSKLCNWMQKDMAVFLHSHGLSDIGLVGMHKMGLSVSKQTFHKFIHHARASHQQHINDIIKHATNCEKRISLMVDDYTNIHTFRRPTFGQSVGVAHMATVLIRVFDQPAIPASGEQIGPANDPAGVDIDSLTAEFSNNMTTILQPFATTAPAHVLALFFTPENERNRLTTHM